MIHEFWTGPGGERLLVWVWRVWQVHIFEVLVPENQPEQQQSPV